MGREKKGGEEGTRKGPQSEKNDPPSSDGWVWACVCWKFLEGARQTSGGAIARKGPPSWHCNYRLGPLGPDEVQ